MIHQLTNRRKLTLCLTSLLSLISKKNRMTLVILYIILFTFSYTVFTRSSCRFYLKMPFMTPFIAFLCWGQLECRNSIHEPSFFCFGCWGSLVQRQECSYPCSFISERPRHGESPPGSAQHSGGGWFISDVLNEKVFTGVCLHKTPFMFDESEPEQISHLLQKMILSLHAPLMWGIMSGLPALPTHEAGRGFLTLCAQYRDTQGESASGMSWALPFTLLSNQYHIINAVAQLSHAGDHRDFFSLTHRKVLEIKIWHVFLVVHVNHKD